MNHPSIITLLIVGLLLVSSCSVLTQAFSVEQIGLDWYAEPFHITQAAEPLVAYSGYTPSQIKTAYNLPQTGGAGKTIAIIGAYNSSTIRADLAYFSNTFNLPAPTESNFEVHNMTDKIATNSGWAEEAALDVEWAHAIAPEAKILLVQAYNNSIINLLAAIDYAKNRPDVVAISMSWGGNEPSNTAYYDSKLTSNYGAVFFASSGDDGGADSDTVLCWPASSSKVVAVGGTTLNLDSYGNVTSETAWSGSGGGISKYENIPEYQVNFGTISSTKRCVPDVSYNANPSTGVPVRCNGYWYKVGGTSAGAPQWAAIHALGVSASNNNLYNRAKVAYSSYFRDIISGSNGYSAGIGYDLATGIGSPLTYKFYNSFEVSPASGGAGTPITLTGIGFSGSSGNISYLNPINSTWISIVNDTAVTLGSLSYATTAPDLMATIASGDNPQITDQIIFKFTNETGYSYNTTVPFREYRRGLTQVGSLTAANIYGNNTTLGASILPQSGNSLSINGRWFAPGNITLLWDFSNLCNTTVDQTGTFSTNIMVPISAAGYHTLTIQDNGYNFTINIASQPTLTNDYNGQWQTSDFPITISADSAVDAIYYRINNGTTQNITEEGQPIITKSFANNTLEYWCNWTLNGVNLETAHVYVMDIKLDKTAPTGYIMADPTTSTKEVTLRLSAVDAESGVPQMCFSNDGQFFSNWEPYASTYSWTLTEGDGPKMVIAKFRNGAGLISTDAVEITLDLPEATIAPQATTSTNPTVAPQTTQTTTPTGIPTDVPTATPVPELPFTAALLLLALTTLLLTLFIKKRQMGMH